MAKLNIDLNDLTPEAKAELSKYIRACAREEIKRIMSDVEKRVSENILRIIIKDIGERFQEFKEICDAEA